MSFIRPVSRAHRTPPPQVAPAAGAKAACGGVSRGAGDRAPVTAAPTRFTATRFERRRHLSPKPFKTAAASAYSSQPAAPSPARKCRGRPVSRRLARAGTPPPPPPWRPRRGRAGRDQAELVAHNKSPTAAGGGAGGRLTGVFPGPYRNNFSESEIRGRRARGTAAAEHEGLGLRERNLSLSRLSPSHESWSLSAIVTVRPSFKLSSLSAAAASAPAPAGRLASL